MNDVEVREYQTTDGKAPLTEWLASLRDGATRADYCPTGSAQGRATR
jgi:hypothetical protein